MSLFAHHASTGILACPHWRDSWHTSFHAYPPQIPERFLGSRTRPIHWEQHPVRDRNLHPVQPMFRSADPSKHQRRAPARKQA
eukprot:scaffold102662_cov21-Tisochrysis_lutea.AAC.5